MTKDFDQFEQYYSEIIDDTYINKHLDKFAKNIGLYIITFSNLENVLNENIAEIMFSDDHSFALSFIIDLSFSQKIKFFYTRCSLQLSFVELPKYTKELKKIKNILEEINKYRNIIAHANWQSLDKNNYLYSKMKLDSENGYIKLVKEKITPVIIKKEINKINKTTKMLENFVFNLEEELNKYC